MGERFSCVVILLVVYSLSSGEVSSLPVLAITKHLSKISQASFSFTHTVTVEFCITLYVRTNGIFVFL